MYCRTYIYNSYMYNRTRHLVHSFKSPGQTESQVAASLPAQASLPRPSRAIAYCYDVPFSSNEQTVYTSTLRILIRPPKNPKSVYSLCLAAYLMKTARYTNGAYPGFCSMKLTRSIATPPGWVASPSQVTPQHFVVGTHLYSWVEILPKNTTQWPQPGLEPGPLDPESNALTMMKTASTVNIPHDKGTLWNSKVILVHCFTRSSYQFRYWGLL